ncbi:MAG: hypothetical protein GXO79_00720 [Chlorobi bacterium]|nr:hypothetical protein [Chlorobiota bacterium]
MKYIILKICTFIFVILLINPGYAQPPIPDIYKDLVFDNNGTLHYQISTGYIPEFTREEGYTLEKLTGSPKGNKTGISFNFKSKNLNGLLYYGFIPYGDSKHPYPVYFRNSSIISNGNTFIDILTNLSGKYDMIGWEAKGAGTIGYRIVNEKGEFLYDGKVSFKGKGPFEISNTIIEGPFINLLGSDSTVISFTTNYRSICKILVNDNEFSDIKKTKNHVIKISGLLPDTKYDYSVVLPDEEKQTYFFKTAPIKGSKKPFVFSYCSDSRNGNGGGERNLNGTNVYMMKKIMAVSNYKQASFMQFTGDLIDGYLLNDKEEDLQFANWKRAVEPFAHYFPVYAGIGNHEAMLYTFIDTNGQLIRIDKFPFSKYSTESVFARNFVNPLNGPQSEDGAYYDPNKNKKDFPPYNETVYYYEYANIAVVVLNSNYLYAPELNKYTNIGGNLHGYIMDNQLNWLNSTLQKFENDSLIDHVFVSIHTPPFPNGGHITNDMWYSGNNTPRPYINGIPVKKGIIERRDEFLDIICNKSTKVVALLTGDEHNYNRLLINKNMKKYPSGWEKEQLAIKRSIIQINNGAAGAPYYAQENAPWTEYVSGFTTQNAVVLIHVDGKKVSAEVINPDTLETVDSFVITE